MCFPSTYQQEVLEICASLRSGSAAGFDNIHIDVVKQNIDVISKPLTRIINLSLSSGIVPKQLKIARIIKLFKSGDQDLYANYRPVSVLPIFSAKFLEKVVHKCLYNFLIKCNRFDNQYGFRKNHSTALALLHLYDTLANTIDNEEYTMGVLIESYLSGREQFVKFNGYCSSYKLVKCGVSQGSVLGPQLFFIYINDICYVSSALDILLFADDTSIFFSHQVLDSLCLTVNPELVKLTD